MVESCIMKRNKEFHLYFDDDIDAIHHSYTFTKWLIDTDWNDIHTTQVALISTRLITKGYRILIHPVKGNVFEITLGACQCTDREIRMCHNLEKMLLNGAFSAEGMVLYE